MTLSRLCVAGLAFCLTAGIVRAAEEAPAGLSLSGVPEQLVVPPPEGANAVLTAKVEVPVRAVWLARSRDSQARYMLSAVGKGVYQVNLADAEVSAMLAAAGAGTCRVFAERPDGELLSSVPISYGVEEGGPYPRGRVAPLPQVYIHTQTGATRLKLSPEAYRFSESLALRAEMAGQGMTFWPAEITPGGYLAEGVVAADWVRPADVESVEVRFSPAARGTTAEARVGKQEWPLAADGRSRSLRLTPEMRRAWQEGETLTLAFSQAGQEEMQVELKAPPEKLDLPQSASLTIIQRYSKPLPGSRGYLTLSIGDITAGQSLVTLRSADGKALIDERSTREGETVPFEFSGGQYTLTMQKMVNLLIGDDYATFVVSAGAPEPGLASERQKIERLIQAVGSAQMTFVRGGVEYSPARAAAHLREKYELVYAEVRTLDAFIERVGSVSWGTGEEYSVRLPDGTRVKASNWLRDLSTKLEAQPAPK
jgi:hypothetical protein